VVEVRYAESRAEDVMKAKVGDRLVQESVRVDEPRRVGVIVGVEHADGGPPYLVRWPDSHESLVFPGPDARVEPIEPPVESR
jgi:hypothetical protein